MEGLPNFEDRESVIDHLIESLAEKEGMNFDDIVSDIITFTELSEEDSDAVAYLEQVAEMIEVSVDKIKAYGVKKAKDL